MSYTSIRSAPGVSLADASPAIASLVAEGKLVVAGGVFDLATGVVPPVEIDAA